MCHRDRKFLLKKIARLHASGSIDAIVVTPHWGRQYQFRPTARQKTLARDLIEAGAIAVIGTHPHVVQPWEKITTDDGREGLVIYSTGNFISGQVRFMRRAGILAMVDTSAKT